MVRGIHTQMTHQNQTLQTEARWLSVVKDHTWRHHEVETSALPVSAFSGSERCFFGCPKRIAVAVQWESRNDQTRGGLKPSARNGSEPGTELIDEHHWLFAFSLVLGGRGEYFSLRWLQSKLRENINGPLPNRLGALCLGPGSMAGPSFL